MKESQTWQKFLSVFKESLQKQSKSSVTVRGYLADLKLFEKWYQGTYGKNSDPLNTKDVDLLSYISLIFRPSSVRLSSSEGFLTRFCLQLQ